MTWRVSVPASRMAVVGVVAVAVFPLLMVWPRRLGRVVTVGAVVVAVVEVAPCFTHPAKSPLLRTCEMMVATMTAAVATVMMVVMISVVVMRVMLEVEGVVMLVEGVVTTVTTSCL